MSASHCTSSSVPASFLRVLSDTASFHDWYLKDIYVANTGKIIHERSKPGFSTVQLEMCTSNNDISYVLIFIDVISFHVSMEHSSDVSPVSFTSFGRCSHYTIDQTDSPPRHTLCFEGDAHIAIQCQKVKCKKLINSPFF